MASVDRAVVASALRELGLYLQLKGDSGFKVRAYEAAAERIAGVTQDLGTLVAEKKLTTLAGIGASIAQKIEEFVQTGKIAALDDARAEFPPRILELLEVPDLGPKKVVTLFHALGVGSPDDLERVSKEGKVRQLPGFGAKTEEKLLRGLEVLRRRGAGGARVPLGEVLPLAERLLAFLRNAPGVVRAELGGSLRRRKETVGDVDVVVAAPSAGPVFETFKTFPELSAWLLAGETSASARLSMRDLQVDVRVLPPEDFATTLHHFTGSKAHHIKLRRMALDKGLTVSEWGVFDLLPGLPPEAAHRPDRKRPVSTEAQLYALLGMQEVPPELREDTGEVELALAGKLPTDFIQASDIVGDVHAHSTWSDGRNSLEEMAQAAMAMGLSYSTVTEHSPTAAYAGGLKVDALKKLWDEIEALNAKFKGFRLLKGVESDILEDGSLDYPDEVLAECDVVVGSIHQRYNQDEEATTRRVLRALSNPHLDIWGHPTGRLIGQREPAPIRMGEALDAARVYGVAVEVNGSPSRLDLSSDHVRMAVDRGVKLVLGTDAHDVDQLPRHLQFAAWTARRGWARKGDVLNTLPVSEFLGNFRRT